MIEKVNASGLPVVAVDIPSGISADTGQIMGTAVRAQLTVTFAFPKCGQIFYPGCAHCGELLIRDIGITDHGLSLSWNLPFCYEPEDLSHLPARTPRSNKGSYGRTVIIGGASGMAGALMLAARAAYRTGCGLVQVLSDEDNRSILQTGVPEALFASWQREENLSGLFSRASVIAIGPGLGTSTDAEKLVREVLERWEGPLIMDADALNILAKHPEYLENTRAKLILTPHPGEMSRLINGDSKAEKLKSEVLKSEILKSEVLKSENEVCESQLYSGNGGNIQNILDHLPETAEAYARAHQLICVLKDARTVVSDGTQTYVNVSGNNGMAVGGSGDVLTGILGGLIAQGMEVFQGTCLGVYLHGLAGDAAKKRLGVRSMLAGDLVESICEVLKNTAE